MTYKNGKKDMFKAEQAILAEAQRRLTSEDQEIDWRDAYAALCDHFSLLLRDAMKITSAGDLSYHRLIKAKEEIERLNRDNYNLAIFDALTGVHNRHYLLDQFGKEYAKAQRYKSPLALVLMDLDHFKQINDAFGHQVGDEVLRTVSARVRDHVRQHDTFGRYGGEEFLLTLPGIDRDDASLVAEKIRKIVDSETVEVGELDITVTVSMGLAQYTPAYDTNQDIFLSRADNAMYMAKSRGRNQIVMDELAP